MTVLRSFVPGHLKRTHTSRQVTFINSSSILAQDDFCHQPSVEEWCSYGPSTPHMSHLKFWESACTTPLTDSSKDMCASRLASASLPLTH